ncbi:MAG: hypothetical protein U0800_22550 [Isosphaeraceae bacterium]
MASDEVQGRVTDEEMALLDGEARSICWPWPAGSSLKLDAETAMGLIGSTRIQAGGDGRGGPQRETVRRPAGRRSTPNGPIGSVAKSSAIG